MIHEDPLVYVGSYTLFTYTSEFVNAACVLEKGNTMNRLAVRSFSFKSVVGIRSFLTPVAVFSTFINVAFNLTAQGVQVKFIKSRCFGFDFIGGVGLGTHHV